MNPAASTDRPLSVLFVCLGNICRSPMAEGVFHYLVEERGAHARYRADSAGTGAWHVGEPPDPRSTDVARRHGIRLRGRARQIRREDFADFDLILAMDSENLRALEEVRRGESGGAELTLLRSFDPESGSELDVPDPYSGGTDGFEDVFEMILRSCAALLDELEEERSW
jgi:protein-tyrosine phosphatase